MTSGRRNSSWLHYPDRSTPHPSQVHNCTDRLIRPLTVSRPSVARSASLLNYFSLCRDIILFLSMTYNMGPGNIPAGGWGPICKSPSLPPSKTKFNKLYQPNVSPQWQFITSTNLIKINFNF